jgi:hypothetical protein
MHLVGKAVFNMPMYFAAALKEPFERIDPFWEGIAEFVCEFEHGGKRLEG